MQVVIFLQTSMNTIGKFESSMKMAAKIMHRGLPTALVLFFMVPVMIPVGEAVWQDVTPTGTKRVSEEIKSNVVVSVDYLIISEDHSPTISVKVTFPYGNNLHHTEYVTHGQFVYTGNKNVSINVDCKTEVATKDWASIAKKENSEGMELETLEGAVKAIHENLLYLRNRDAEMRTASEKTNWLVVSYSIAVMCICVILSLFQSLELKQYIDTKNLKQDIYTH